MSIIASTKVSSSTGTSPQVSEVKVITTTTMTATSAMMILIS